MRTLPSILFYLLTVFLFLPGPVCYGQKDGATVLPQPGVKQAPGLVGEWVVESVDADDLVGAVFVFSADGSVVRRIGKVEIKGSFVLSEDGKTLEIDSEEGDETLEVAELTEDTLTIVTEDEKVVLRRREAGEGDGEKVEPKPEVGGDLVGRWKMTALGGEAAPEGEETIFEFRADGTVARMRGGTVKNGAYLLSEDGAVLTLSDEDGGRGEEMDVVTLTHSTLSLKKGKNSIDFARVPALDREEGGAAVEGDAGAEGKAGEEGKSVEKVEGEKEVEDPDPAVRVKDGKIYGRWRVLEMEGIPEDAEKPLFQFNSDGTVTGTFGEQKKTGKFKLADDRSTLTMMEEGKSLEEGDVADVVELSDTVMELKVDGSVLKFERVRE